MYHDICRSHQCINYLQINSTFAQDYLNEQSVNNNVDTIKKPVDPPKLRVGKKRKEYKKEHPMSLRSRRPSKLQSNKLIAESCTPVRKVALKRKKNSSDEDEPLIFQINRLKQKASRETASREDILKPSSSKENHLKPSTSRENTLKPCSAEEESLKNKPCQKRFKKDVTTNNIITNEVTTQKTITKEEITTKSTTKKISIKACEKKTARRGVKQIIAKKTQKKKNKKKRKHKKCSPKQHARVAPECSVPEFPVTVRTEDVTDLGTLGNFTFKEIVPYDPQSPNVPNNTTLHNGNKVPKKFDTVLIDLGKVFYKELCPELYDESKVKDNLLNGQKDEMVYFVVIYRTPVLTNL